MLCYRLIVATGWLNDDLAMLVAVLLFGLTYVPLSSGVWGRSILRRGPTPRELTSGILALGLALAVWALLKYTVLGFDIRALGANANAARFAGVPITRTIVLVSLLSGGLAGLAGAVEVAGRTAYVTLDMSPGYGYSGIVTDENLQVVFGYKNNTDRDVAGVKGYVSVKDLFGEEISGFLISNDNTIPAGQSATWTGSRSVRFALGDNKDRKLAELGEDKYKVVWEPEMIVFKDGTKLTAPKE